MMQVSWPKRMPQPPKFTFGRRFAMSNAAGVRAPGTRLEVAARSTTRVLFFLCIMYFITYVDRVNVSTAASIFGKELNLSNTQIGFVFSAFAYFYLLFQIIGGWIGDKFGPRRTLTICSFIWAGATVLTGLSGGLVSMVLARILLGLGEGATFPAATQIG